VFVPVSLQYNFAFPVHWVWTDSQHGVVVRKSLCTGSLRMPHLDWVTLGPLWIDLLNFDRNSMVLYVDLHSMPGFLCRHGLSQAFCENLWSLVCNYRNIWESVCSMSCYGIYDRSMVNYILWLEKQVFLMYLNQRCSLIVPCTSPFSILQPNSQAVVGWAYCYLPASMRQLEHCSTPLSNKSITFSQFWILPISPLFPALSSDVCSLAWSHGPSPAEPN